MSFESIHFCRTNAVLKPLIADVVVGNRAGFTAAKDKFRYETTDIISSPPNIGPHSGGTRIYITGLNLNIGSNLEVYLDYFPCIVDKMLASSTQISCRTTASKSSSYVVRHLVLKIDNATLTLPRPFRYVPDPTILRIYPLKSYMSGGRTVTVLKDIFFFLNGFLA
jgi:plexin A